MFTKPLNALPFTVFFTLTILCSKAWSDSSSLFDLTLEELMAIPVTGSTLSEKKSSNAPSSVTVFNAAFIRSLGVSYLYELLNYAPGFQSQRSGESAIAFGYSVRGRRNSNQSKESLLILDGMILNSPRSGAANGSVRMLSVNQIERVEIIRGPGSVLYGSGAYSAVINVVTKKGMRSVSTSLGDFETKELSTLQSFSVGLWQSDVYAFVHDDKGEKYRLNDSFSQDEFIETNDGYFSSEVRLNLVRQHPVYPSEISIMQYSGETNDFYSLETLSNDFNQSTYQHRQLQISQSLPLSKVENTFSLSTALTERRANSQQSAEGEFAPVSNEPLVYKALLRSQSLSAQVRSLYSYSKNIQLQWGFQWNQSSLLDTGARVNYDINSILEDTPPFEYFGDFSNNFESVGPRKKETSGAYIQSEIIDGSSEWVLGGRYDRDSRGLDQLSPRLGWVKSLNNLNTLKILYGQAFRAPSLNEGLDPDSNIERGNPDLVNEAVETFDVVYIRDANAVRSQLGVYYSHYRDPILVQYGEDGVREFINGDDSENMGLELEVFYQLRDNIWLRTSASHLFLKPDAFFRESTNTGSVAFNYQGGRLEWNISVLYHGSRQQQISAIEKRDLSNYWLWYGRVGFRHTAKWLSELKVTNLFDRQYDSAAQGGDLSEGVPNRGRGVVYTLNYAF